MKFPSRQTLLIIILVELIISLGLVLYSAFAVKKSANKTSATSATTVIIPPIKEPVKLPVGEISYGFPLRLKIPSIKVDAAVEIVGTTSGGAMDVPKNPAGVGWFDLTIHPGNTGTAVIAGHYGIWKNGQETVFNQLNKLIPGDKISVLDDKGVSISFKVREIRSFNPSADASTVFTSSDDKSHLNLITCEGTWNDATKSYSKRLVVFTDKE